MKAIHALLLLMFVYMTKADVEGFSHNKCSSYEPGKDPAFSLDFCRSTNYDGYARCCFVKLEDKNENRLYHCQPIDNQQWADIELLETKLENEGYEVVDIECSSSYLYASLLLLFALLI